MKRLLSLLAPLALGLFIGKYYGEWIEPVTVFGPIPGLESFAKRHLPNHPAPASSRAPASLAPDLQAEDNVPEAALALFSKMNAASIRSVCETARELYATKAITNYARYIRDFTNYTEHEDYLKRKAQVLKKESQAWRGTGQLRMGDSTVALEVLVTPPSAQSPECYGVQIFASRDGELRQSESGTHCIGDMGYRDGNYYFTWAGASGSLYHMDISAILISLPKSKVDSVTYMTDGRDEWQTADTFSWSPVTVEEQTVRLAQLLNELNLVNQ